MTKAQRRQQSISKRLAVLQGIADGQSDKQLSSQLGISETMVGCHINVLFSEFEVQSRTRCELVAKAFRAGALK